MQRKAVVGSLVAMSFALGGCASIVDGSTQVVSVQAVNQGGDDVDGAHCKLINSKGEFFVNTPGTVSVHRDGADLNVDCKKSGLKPGIAVVKSHAKGMAFGNILAGGIIGGAVDMSTGAAYDYPTMITVEMGKSVTLGEPPKPAASEASPSKTAMATDQQAASK